MTPKSLLQRLLVASAAVGAVACGARTGDQLDDPRDLLRAGAGVGGRAGSAQGGSAQAGSAGAAQAGSAQAGSAGKAQAGSAGAAGKPISVGCFEGASCVAGSWCSPDKETWSVCECGESGFECDQPYPWGKSTKVCFEPASQDSDCPPFTSPSLQQQLPWTFSCTGVESGPTLELIGGSAEHPACCYGVQNFGCGGRPLIVEQRGRTAGIVARRDWA
ncbi:MAG: hypothetical protein IT374_02375 [Polyangiaceae bacterium]|nr:hypothetical protein [Polyangiaceae bacterium]